MNIDGRIVSRLIKVARVAAEPGEGMTRNEVKAEFLPDAARLILAARDALHWVEAKEPPK